ncbi:sodium:solute symporter family protein [Amycolatopsis taiwanensis]|uniref:sodium:solute symporter family protein n=1 Tax=Amycolatopsis taiwanensis TaxID=342230 RepID=UPI002556A322|nr:sodium:solute symporter family protein [Amycolatopsis taiwanensis]
MTYFIALLVSVGSIAVGAVLAARGRRVDVTEWAVGGRRFGSFLFWFVLAGETFTTFALLGASQTVYVNGAAGYYVLGTVVLTSAIGYWVVPRIWRAGNTHGLLTEGDYFTRRFNAPWLGAVLALFGIVGLLLYSEVQLTGLALILRTLFGNGLSNTVYVAIAGIAVAAFVLTGGMRSAAFGSVVKDLLLLIVLLVIAFSAASAAHVDGWGGIFDAVARQHPTAATLPGMTGGTASNSWWWMSFLLLTPIGAFVLPHSFQVSYTARDVATIRRNQIVQPLYSLFYILVIVIALAALLVEPGMKGADANSSLLVFVRDHSPGWLVGLLAGAGILVALVPTGVLLLTCSSLFTRNVYPLLRKTPGDREQLRVSRIAMIVLAAIAVAITASQNNALVNVMVNVYNAIGQLAPALFLSLLWRRITAIGTLCGVIAGTAGIVIPPLSTALLTLCPAGTVVGLPALVLNIIVTVLVSLATKAPDDTAIAVGMPTVDTPRHRAGVNRPVRG